MICIYLKLLLFAIMAKGMGARSSELSLEPNFLQKDISTCSIKWYLSTTITLQGWSWLKAITISDSYSIPKTYALLLWLFYTFLPFINHQFTSENVKFQYPWLNRKCLLFTFKWYLMMMFYTFYEFTFCYLTFQFAT